MYWRKCIGENVLEKIEGGRAKALHKAKSKSTFFTPKIPYTNGIPGLKVRICDRHITLRHLLYDV